MRIAPELGDVAIVLLGSFNPRIFRPDWFAKSGLVSQDEANAADIELIHSEITIFRMDWLSVRVEQQRFQVITQEAPFVRLSDLVIRTFKEFLSHTPIGKIGINRGVHFGVGGDEARDRIGTMLAPKEPWGDWGPTIKGGEGEKRGGLRDLIMEQRDLEDRYKGYIRAKVEPSVKIKAGIFMQINDHFEVEDAAVFRVGLKSQPTAVSQDNRQTVL